MGTSCPGVVEEENADGRDLLRQRDAEPIGAEFPVVVGAVTRVDVSDDCRQADPRSDEHGERMFPGASARARYNSNVRWPTSHPRGDARQVSVQEVQQQS